MSDLYEVKKIEGRGLACVALKNIKKGALILATTVDCCAETNKKRESREIKSTFKNILTAFEQMKKSDQEEFLKLFNPYDDKLTVESSPVLKMNLTNFEINLKGLDKDIFERNKKILGIYMTHSMAGDGVSIKKSQFKHSCKPNAILEWTGEAFSGLRAIKKIKAGQEITYNTFGANSCLSMLTRKRRIEIIYDKAYFLCTCDFCKEDVIEDPKTDYSKLEEFVIQEETLRLDCQFANSISETRDLEDYFEIADLSLIHQNYSLEKCKKHLEIIHILFNHGKEKKFQPICLHGLLETGYHATVMGYLLTEHRGEKKKFQQEALSFIKTAEKFEELLGKEIVQPEVWLDRKKRWSTPIMYTKFTY